MRTERGRKWDDADREPQHTDRRRVAEVRASYCCTCSPRGEQKALVGLRCESDAIDELTTRLLLAIQAYIPGAFVVTVTVVSPGHDVDCWKEEIRQLLA